MKIRNRITIWFTLVTGLLFLLVTLLIYLFTDAILNGFASPGQMANLRIVLIFSWLFAVIVIFFTSRWLSKQLFRPVSRMADKAGEISATNLHLRLSETAHVDEMAVLAASFNRMLDRLENAFDGQREFVSNIAHELRTPLSAIIGELQLVLEEKDLSQDLRISLESMLNDARKLSRLSTGLMDIAKASYETHQISLKHCRLDELIMDARKEVLRNHPEYQVQIKMDDSLDDEDYITVRGNSYLLTVAFANLMDNACKFSSDHRVEIFLTYDRAASGPVISFTDRGPGIPADEQQDIFQPFFRGSNKTASEGSGIGLTLVQRIVTLHGAKLSLDSAPGKGTTMRIHWPSR